MHTCRFSGTVGVAAALPSSDATSGVGSSMAVPDLASHRTRGCARSVRVYKGNRCNKHSVRVCVCVNMCVCVCVYMCVCVYVCVCVCVYVCVCVVPAI